MIIIVDDQICVQGLVRRYNGWGLRCLGLLSSPRFV